MLMDGGFSRFVDLELTNWVLAIRRDDFELKVGGLNPRVFFCNFVLVVVEEQEHLHFPVAKCKPSRNKVKEVVIHWVLSPLGWTKFNVPSVAKEDEAKCCGGVERQVRIGTFMIFWADDAFGPEIIEEFLVMVIVKSFNRY
ncbi:hypothetical protein Golax_018288 [Gossypium laxum]|uniref:Uncharacterized protein n=1 Tax=Gossypium laxum TaxID=34288 RepID=A0A7J8Z3M3_9ROSI|nr:hypothetical protein [Gossypium laxum]